MNSNDEDFRFLYLLRGSYDVLPSSCFKLRSYLNIHLSNLADQQNIQLFKSLRNRNKTCPYCYSPRSGDTTSFTLLPAKRFRGNKSQNKISEERDKETPEVNESRNTLVVKCKICGKKSPFSLVKKRFVVKSQEVTGEPEKKKKKKRDKSCGLAVNLIGNEIRPPETVAVKQKRRTEEMEKTMPVNPMYLQSGVQPKVIPKNIPISKNLSGSTSKNLVPNPFAAQIQQGNSGRQKKNKKLERLKQAVKEEKNSAKKTLEDFLTLV